jgi:hypothetical protein
VGRAAGNAGSLAGITAASRQHNQEIRTAAVDPYAAEDAKIDAEDKALYGFPVDDDEDWPDDDDDHEYPEPADAEPQEINTGPPGPILETESEVFRACGCNPTTWKEKFVWVEQKDKSRKPIIAYERRRGGFLRCNYERPEDPPVQVDGPVCLLIDSG